jgi:hypothetical protein
MAQKQIDLFKLQQQLINETKSTGTQTDNILYQFDLSRTKYIQIYKSKSLKKNVFSINLDSKKKIIITPSMWNIIKNNKNVIDAALGN